MKIYIGADIVPTECNMELFFSGSKEKLICNELSKILLSADYIIMNLETPLSDVAAPIKKLGPNLITPTTAIAGIKAINPYFYTLANNHIMDQGEIGLNSTIECLRREKIDYCGIGNNLKEVKHSFVKEIGKIKLGIYCCAEHEFSIATDSKPGANPYDPLLSFDHVRELSNTCDYTIVLYHGGKEFYRYPSPQLRRVFRKFADCGANLVIAQHTHCIGCRENYNGAELVYGQGNFLFNKGNDEYWNSALLICVEYDESKNTAISYYPVVRNQVGVRLANDDEGTNLIEDFYHRSEEIIDPMQVEKKYQEFAEKKYLEYATCFQGNSLFMRAIKKLFGDQVASKLIHKGNIVRLKDFIECEAHRELYLAAIEKRI